MLWSKPCVPPIVALMSLIVKWFYIYFSILEGDRSFTSFKLILLTSINFRLEPKAVNNVELLEFTVVEATDLVNLP
jgi:hypothetical protein